MLKNNFSLKHMVEVSFGGTWMSMASHDLLKTMVDMLLESQLFC